MTPERILEEIRAIHGAPCAGACELLYDIFFCEALLVDAAKRPELEELQAKNMGALTTLVATSLGMEPSKLAELMERLDAAVKA